MKKKTKSTVSLLLTIVFIFSLSVSVFAESEPNDSFDTADKLTLGSKMSGSLHNIDENYSDYFYFNSGSNTSVKIKLSGDISGGANQTQYWIKYYAYDSNGNALLYGETDATLTTKANTKYYIEVYLISAYGSPAHSYSLTVSSN